MNSKMLSVVLAGLFLVAFASVEALCGQHEKTNSDYISQVSVGEAERFDLKITYPLLFEEEDLPSRLKKNIAKDISRLLSDGIDCIEIVPLPEEDLRVGSMYQIYDTKITHRLDIKGPYRMLFPNVLKRYLKGVVKIDNTYHFLIHRRVIEKYREAFKLETKHPAMFAKIDEFLAIFGNREMMNELATDARKAKRMLYLPKGKSLNDGISLIREYATMPHLRVKYPSLLNIVALEKAFPGQGTADTEVFVMLTPVGWLNADRDGHSNYLVEPYAPGAYVNGQWRLFVAPMP